VGMAGAAWRPHRVRTANTLQRMERGAGARRTVFLGTYANATTACRRRAPTAISMALLVARVVSMGIK